jgi:hypothetical protein
MILFDVFRRLFRYVRVSSGVKYIFREMRRSFSGRVG